MQQMQVGEQPAPGGLSRPTGFLGQVSSEYNRRHDRPEAAPVEKYRLIAWLALRAEGHSNPDGLSILESEILRARNDVRKSVLENGAINVCRMRLWAITYGAHELGLDEDMLADTVNHALALRDGCTDFL